MAHAPVTAQVHQAFDVHVDFPAQVPLHRQLSDLGANGIELVVGKVGDLGIFRHTCGAADVRRGTGTYAEHIGQ